MNHLANEHSDLVEDVQVNGHIIDSLILPKILDLITASGGSFRIKNFSIGQSRTDPSYALIEVRAPSSALLAEILGQIGAHGAVPVTQNDCQLVPADMTGVFPEGFYSTTNQRTEIRVAGHWIEVTDQEMDCGIAFDPINSKARCVPMSEVEADALYIVGHAGVRVFPHEQLIQRQTFEFMNSPVSTEKPKGVAIRQVALELFRNRAAGGKTLLVGGPAIVHTGSAPHLCELIQEGYVDLLFAGNALATHDIEQAFFGTSLGVHARSWRSSRSWP